MKIWILLFISPFILSAYQNEERILLSREDFDWLLELNNRGPHLSSASDDEYPWESFDKWQCFETNSVNIECATYEKNKTVPSLVIEGNGQTFLFDAPVEENFDCDEVTDSWSKLLAEAGETCIMAAEMPQTFEGAEDISLWYIRAIKTKFGYWTTSSTVPLPIN